MVETQNRLKVSAVEGFLAAAFDLVGHGHGRNGLLARLKVLRTHGYPDTVTTDRDLRKGYTALQTLKLLAVFALLDHRYVQGEAIEIVTRHETAMLATIAIALDVSRYPNDVPVENDMFVILPRRALDDLRERQEEIPKLVIAKGWKDIVPLPEIDELHRRTPTVIDLATPVRRGMDWLERKQGLELPNLESLLASAKERVSSA